MESNHALLRDMFWASKILGTFPFGDDYRLSKKWFVYCFVVRFLSVIGSLGAFYHPSQLYAKFDENLSMGKAMRLVPLIAAIGEKFFCVVWWPMKRETVTSLMENTMELLRKSKAPPKSDRVRLVHCLIFLAFLTGLYSFYSSKRQVQDACNVLSAFLVVSSLYASTGQFWDLLHLLGILFEDSTRLLDENAVVTYEKFTRLSAMVNDTFELKILFTITLLFISIILYLYILLLPLHPGVNKFSVLTAIYAITSIIPIVIIIHACDNFMNKEKNFNLQLRKRMIEDKYKISLRSEKLNFHFLVRQETVFSACGFFTIDRSLFCSMISAATTYLVIVLQYGNE